VLFRSLSSFRIASASLGLWVLFMLPYLGGWRVEQKGENRLETVPIDASAVQAFFALVPGPNKRNDLRVGGRGSPGGHFGGQRQSVLYQVSVSTSNALGGQGWSRTIRMRAGFNGFC